MMITLLNMVMFRESLDYLSFVLQVRANFFHHLTRRFKKIPLQNMNTSYQIIFHNISLISLSHS